MTRSKRLVLVSLIALAVSPSRPADAFWKKIGKMSGPELWGVDAILPVSIDGCHLDFTEELVLEGVNRLALNSTVFAARGRQIPNISLLAAGPEAFLRDAESVRILGEYLGNDDLKSWNPRSAERDGSLLESYVRTREQQEGRVLDGRTPEEQASNDLARQTGKIIDDRKAEFPGKVRYFGLSAGFFNSQRVLKLRNPHEPNARKEGCRADDLYFGRKLFTLSLGYAQSYSNELAYEDHVGSRTVRFVTLYPAFEYRVPVSGVESSLFANAGPAAHLFWGEAFDAFSQVSARMRLGASIGRFQLGVELDFFIPELKHSKFGSVDPGAVRVGWAVFMGLEVSRWLR